MSHVLVELSLWSASYRQGKLKLGEGRQLAQDHAAHQWGRQELSRPLCPKSRAPPTSPHKQRKRHPCPSLTQPQLNSGLPQGSTSVPDAAGILFTPWHSVRQVTNEQSICLAERLRQNKLEIQGSGRWGKRESGSLPGGVQRTEDVFGASEHIIPSRGKSLRTNTKCYISLACLPVSE